MIWLFAEAIIQTRGWRNLDGAREFVHNDSDADLDKYEKSDDDCYCGNDS
jgi:hypothetical protein